MQKRFRGIYDLQGDTTVRESVCSREAASVSETTRDIIDGDSVKTFFLNQPSGKTTTGKSDGPNGDSFGLRSA